MVGRTVCTPLLPSLRSGISPAKGPIMVFPTRRLAGLEVPASTFFRWRDRPLTAAQVRRAGLDVAVKTSFDDSGGNPVTYGSPRVFADLIEEGCTVSTKTVADSMRRQGLYGRPPKRKEIVDPPRQGRSTHWGPGQTRLQGLSDQPQVVWRFDRDPHRRRQTTSSDCWRLGFAAPPGVRHG